MQLLDCMIGTAIDAAACIAPLLQHQPSAHMRPALPATPPQIMPVVGAVNLACSAATAASSSQRGEAWALPAAKALAAGPLALVEVLLMPPEES